MCPKTICLANLLTPALRHPAMAVPPSLLWVPPMQLLGAVARAAAVAAVPGAVAPAALEVARAVALVVAAGQAVARSWIAKSRTAESLAVLQAIPAAAQGKASHTLSNPGPNGPAQADLALA